jgi:hypothetical protein
MGDPSTAHVGQFWAFLGIFWQKKRFSTSNVDLRPCRLLLSLCLRGGDVSGSSGDKAGDPGGRGFCSSTFQLNVSTFWEIHRLA